MADERPQLSNEVKGALARKGLALGELMWKLITEAGFSTGTGLKLRDRDKFAALNDGEKRQVINVAILYLRGSDEITRQFNEEIDRIRAEETKGDQAPEAEAVKEAEDADDIEEPASVDAGPPPQTA